MKTVELREKAKTLSSDVLDEIIHDMKADEAASINNEGKDAQIEYIIDNGNAACLQKMLESG